MHESAGDMEQWKEEDLHALAHVCDAQGFFDHCVAGIGQLDFDSCSFGLAVPLPVSAPSIVIYNTYPARWWARYEQERYVDIDPSIAHAMSSVSPLFWSDAVFAPAPHMWEDVRAHGMEVGWGQPTRGAGGAVGMLTLARGGAPVSARELAKNGQRMAYMAQLLAVGMTALLLPALVPEAGARLTPREREIMRWTADGKTSYEIGRILTLSISAVNFHIANAVVKLNAVNKIQAVVKAAMLGLLR